MRCVFILVSFLGFVVRGARANQAPAALHIIGVLVVSLIFIGMAGFAGAQTNPCTYIAPGATQQITGPDGVCKKITNNNGTNNLCVMTATTAEWQSFYNNPNGATVAACPAACGGATVGGYCWYASASGASCDTTCTGHGGYNSATLSYAGSAGTNANCTAVMQALIPSSTWNSTTTTGYGIGCYHGFSTWIFRDAISTTTSSATALYTIRVCACNN